MAYSPVRMSERTPAKWIAVVSLTTVAVCSVVALACSGSGAKAPNPTRPIAEARAVRIIRETMEAEGVSPAPARVVELRSGRTIEVDVSVEGKSFGVAYVTEPEARELGDAIPPRNMPDERLHIALAGASLTARIVLLYEQNYVHDDLVGEGHEKTAITAERQLERDVRDFVSHAQSQGYP